MKNKLIKLPLMLVAVSLLLFSSCKKESAADDSISATDQTAVSNAMNSISDDATNAAAQVSGISGKTEGVVLRELCGTTATGIDTSTLHEIILTYDGTTSCYGVIRTGQVTIQLTSGNEWKDENAVLTVSYNNLQFTDVATGGSFTLTGSQTITNETGGLAYDVFVNGAPGPVSHRHQGNLTITFNDNTTRNWTIDRTRTFTRTTGNYVNVKLSSEASGNVSASGTNRYGEAFTNAITTPIQATNNPGCLWKPYVGTFIHKIANRTVTVDFGVDSGDNQVGSADNCAANDGFFVTYTRANRTRTRFVEYWH